MAGELIQYFTVEKNDFYYAKRGSWVGKEHLASFFNRETAERIQKRYPGSVVSENRGHGVWLKSFEDVDEPDSKIYLEQALKMAVLEIPKSDIEAIVRGVLEPSPDVVQEQPKQWTRTEIEEIVRQFIFMKTNASVFSAASVGQ